MSAARALFLTFLILGSLPAFATTSVTMLFDVDRDVATGCAAHGMAGLEYVATATINESVVTSITARRCVEGTLLLAGTTPGGWPAPLTSHARNVELSLPYAAIGTSPGAPLRVGFIIDDDGVLTTLLHAPAGGPIELDLSTARRRAARPAAGGVVPVIDGEVSEWTYVRLFAATGPVSVWLHPAGDRLFFRFELRSTSGDTPVANPDSYEARQARPLPIPAPGVLANDVDPNDRPLTAIAVTPPQFGSLELAPDGSFVYVHDGSAETVDAFQYQAGNGIQESNVTTVMLQIAPNGLPVANDDSFAMTGGSLAVPAPGVLANDSDPEADPLVAEIATPPTHGTLTLNADGSLTYVSAAVPQNDSFTYRAFDGVSASDPATVSIAADVPANTPPVAVADVFTTDEDVALVVSSPGLLQNDTDADGDALTVEILSTPASGTLTALPDGSFEYTPALDFFGVDGFAYRIFDGTATSAAAHVAITVNAVNDAPVAANDSAIVPEGGSTAIDLLLNDSDTEGDPLTLVILGSPSHGTLTAGAGGAVTYTHDGGESLTDSFTYAVNDGTASSPAAVVTITITPVNDAPIATADAATVPEGGSTNIDVLANDQDPDDSTFLVSIVAAPVHGTATVNANGSIAYVHDGSETIADTLTYSIDDGEIVSNIVPVAITITPVNDAPVAANDALTVNEAATASVQVLANDSDPDSASLTASIVGAPAHGIATVQPDGSVTYVHDGSETLSDSFTYTATDGSATSSAATVAITIIPVNDVPAANPDTATVSEGASVSIAVLANDIDPDSSLMPAIVSPPTNGTLVVNGDGTITYTHDGSETLSDSFTYVANDGLSSSAAAAVTISITPVNDVPVAADDDASLNEGMATIIPVLANDTDAEGSALTPVLVTSPAAGAIAINGDGTLTYTHDGSETTADVFTYRASDGSASSNVATVSITITPVNDAPVAVDDSATVAEGASISIVILANDTDPDSASLMPAILSAPAHGTATLEADGSVTYVHDGGESSSDSFTYEVSDGTATSNTATVTLTITRVNDAPVAVPDTAVLDEGTALAIAVTANDTDAEGTTLVPQLMSAPLNGTATVNGDGTITYTHSGTETTSDSFTYRVTDGVATSNTVSVTLTINLTNDAPVAVADSSSVDEGGAINIPVQANDTDEEGDAVTTVIVTPPLHGTTSVLADGSVDYQHDGSETTSDSFVYLLNDGTTNGNAASVAITITPVNDVPDAVDDLFTVNEGESFDIDVLANDTDAENESLTLTVLAAPTHGTAAIVAGAIRYVHDGTETSSDSFTYTITDPAGASDSATVTITVTAVNDAPVANDDTASVNEGGATAINVLANDTDAEGDGLVPTVVAGPAHGTALVNGDGTITYTQNGAEQIADSFTYSVNDGTTDSNVASVSISIDPVNDAPIARADTAVVNEGGAVIIPVLANDSDAENDSLTVILDASPANGSVLLNPDGTFTYTHDGSETTTDSFDYHLFDSAAASSTVTVSITVTPVNDPPSAADDAYDYPTDGSSLIVPAPGVLANDTDIDSALTAVLVSGPPEGTLTLNSDGSFEYTKAPAGSLTTLTFSYEASDGLATSNTATVTITLNTAPVAADDSFTVREDNLLTVPADGVLANDIDAQGNITRTVLLTGPDCLGQPAGGCGSLLGAFPLGEDALQNDGSFTYLPPAHFAGTVTFTYKLEDGGGLESNEATVTITVTPVNDPPEFEVTLFNVSVPNDGKLHTWTGFADLIQPGPNEAADESAQQVRFEAAPANPSLFRYFFDVGSGVFDGDGVHVDESGTLWINPNALGTTTIEVVAIDNGGTADGGDDTSDAFIISVSVVNSNVAPSFTVMANHTVAEDSTAASVSNYITNILAPESTQTVTMSITGNTNTALFSAGPSLTGSGGSRGLTFTPAPNAFGVATLTIRAQDNGSPVQFTEKTATITISGVNDPPSFVKGTDLQYGAGVMGAQSIPAWATSISPGPNETGQTLTFNVTVRTGASVFATTPAINATTGELTFNLNGTAGLATIDVKLSDNGGGANMSATQTFLIAAGGVNTPPSFVKGADVTRLEDSGAYTGPWATAISDGDPAATQAVSFLVTNSNNALFAAQPTVAPDGTLAFTPAPNAFGSADVTVRAQDDGGTANGGVDTSDPQIFRITITGVNDQPSFTVSQPAITRGENGGLQTIAGFAIANPGPLETGQTFTYTVSQTSGDPLFSGASAPAIAANGTLTFQTAIDAIGTATFSAIVKDNGGTADGGVDTSTAQSFTITITDGNVTIPATTIAIDAYPNIPISITNDASDLTYRLLEGVTVPAGKGPATVLITSKPANSLVTIDDPLTGAFTFRSGTLAYSAGAVQPQSFKFRACDTDGNCSAERTVTVNFGSRPLIFFIDDSSPQSPGLHTFDIPGRMMHTGFTHTSPAPAATYIVMSGTYTNGTTQSPVNTRIRSGDQVLGQGLSGLTFASLGVVDLPVGTLPALPDLSTGTTPRLHMPDPEERSGGGIIVHEGSFFLGYGGGTVRNLRMSKTRDHMNSWIMISRKEFTTLGGDYLFDQITCDNGQSIVIGQTTAGTVTIRNSTLNISEGFASNNGTFVIENTDINLYRSDGSRTALFYNFSSPGVVAQSYTIDAASSVTLQPAADLFSTSIPVGSFRINAPLTVTRTGSVNGLVINGITSVELNGKVDVTTVGGKPLVVSNVGSLAMPHAANAFRMTNTLAGFGSTISMSNVGVGAAGVMLSNLALDGGNLSFNTTSGGTITVASGTVVGNGAQNCVDRVGAANVVIDPSVVFTDCTP